MKTPEASTEESSTIKTWLVSNDSMSSPRHHATGQADQAGSPQPVRKLEAMLSKAQNLVRDTQTGDVYAEPAEEPVSVNNLACGLLLLFTIHRIHRVSQQSLCQSPELLSALTVSLSLDTGLCV